jgi:hypothetical protein
VADCSSSCSLCNSGTCLVVRAWYLSLLVDKDICPNCYAYSSPLYRAYKYYCFGKCKYNRCMSFKERESYDSLYKKKESDIWKPKG